MKLRSVLQSGGIFFFTVLFLWCFAPLGIDLHHDGVMLVPAVDIASGKVLFRESFNQYGLLTSLLHALAVKIGGAELAALHCFTVLLYGAAAVLLDKIWRRFLSPGARFFQLLLFWGLTPSLMVPFHPWSSVCALFFFLLAEEMLLQAWERPEKMSLLYWSGFSAGACLLSRHPVGAMAGLAAGCSLLLAYGAGKEFFRRTLPFGLGALTPLAAGALYLTWGGAWRDFATQCIGFVGRFAWERGGSGNWSSFCETMFPFLSSMGFWDMIYGCFPLAALGLLLTAVRSRQGGRMTREQFLPLATVLIFGLAGWHQYYPVPCVRHLYWGSIGMLGAWSLLGMHIGKIKGKMPGKVVLYLLWLLPVLLAFTPRVQAGFLRASGRCRRVRVDLPGARGLLLSRGEAQLLMVCRVTFDRLPEPIRKRGVLNHTPDGFFSILLPRAPFPSPMFVNWGRMPYRDYPEQIRQYVEQVHPVVLTTSPEYFYGYAAVLEFDWMGNRYRMMAPLQ